MKKNAKRRKARRQSAIRKESALLPEASAESQPETAPETSPAAENSSRDAGQPKIDDSPLPTAHSAKNTPRRPLLILLALLGGALLLLMICVAVFWFYFDVSSWQRLDSNKLHGLAQTTSVYDADGNLISVVRGAEHRTSIPLSSISKQTQMAFIAAEDLRFYEHKGVDLVRIIGALRSNVRTGSFAEGASTITQQLAKLTHLSADKTIRRKLEEISIALQIEQQYDKDAILEMYLNTVYFGRGAYGIQTAAEIYFGVDAADLTLAQSVSLAAAIKAPSAYAPHVRPELNRTRRLYILQTMLEHGAITQAEYDEAAVQDIWVAANVKNEEAYSWYVDEALNRAQALLSLSADEIVSGGYSIYTSYSPHHQQIADKLYADKSFFPANASDGTPVQSALAVLDTQSGAILAMVGGRDYAVRRGLNRATQMRRQPGSALKPLAVYGPALDKGYTTASVLLDEKTSFGGYTPQNAGDRYYGRVTLRTALRNSLNTTAVRLLDEIGISAGIEYLSRMGIRTEESDRNLSLALGSMTYGVTPVELAAAYIPFANGGIYHDPYLVERIEAPDGTLLYEHAQSGKQVITAQNAFLMTSLLQSVVSSGTGTRMLSAGTPVAGKTGTVSMTGGNRDIWMAAYNPEISVACWMGFDQTDAAHKIPNGTTGGRNTASLTAAFFKQAYQGRDKPQFTQPGGLVWLTIDKRALTATGSVVLASDSTPKDYRLSEVFLSSNRPYAVSDLWTAPSAPSSFYVAHDSAGFPQLHFKAVSSARYRIQRDAVGESVILAELHGDSGQQMTYNDRSALSGVLYTYRVIPIHEELLEQGVWLEGQQAVQLAQVTASSGLLGSLMNLIPSFGIQ